MPRSLLIAALLLSGCLVVIQRGQAADDYPYTAYVTKPQAEVLSGPARKFYLTHQLYAGEEVQVYKRDAAGWLGIRPPEDSFSWIPADVVEPTDDEGIHRVLIETPSWIGTSVEAIQDHKYQVKLKPGELVEVIGEKQLRTSDGNETWFKIAPPAGEFRWIHTSDVSRSPPREQDLAEAKPTKPARQGRNPQDTVAAIGTGVDRIKESLASFKSFERAPLPANTPPAMALKDLKTARTEAREAEEIRLAQHEQPVTINRNPGPAGDGFVPRKPRKLDNSSGVPAPSTDLRMASREQLQNSIRETPSPTKSSNTNAAATTAAVSANSFDAASATAALKQLDLELSLHLSQPRALWNLEPIRKQAQEFVDKGASPQERGQARLLLEKIRKFEETFELPNDALLAAQTANASAASPSAPRYDGVGLLQPVLSRSGQSSVAPYAIVDADGNPVAFVTPGKGLDLRRYENKPVGIYGKRGIIEALKKPHLVAERVIDLSTR